YRWHGQRCSAPRPPFPAVLTSTARAPLAASNRQRDQLGLRCAIEDALSGRGWRMVTGQDGFEPFLDQLLAGPGNCADAGIQSRGDLAVAPSFASLRGVGLQQDARLQPPPRRVFALMDQCVEPVACN